MNIAPIRVVVFDVDGTITQHKTSINETNKEVLDDLSKRYKLLIVGAGSCHRIHKQLNDYPLDVIGNYGMQAASFNHSTGKLVIEENKVLPIDKVGITQKVNCLRRKFNYTEYAGDTVEFHDSGMFTFPLLGTKAGFNDKIVFDSDRKKRRKIYPTVVEAFCDYNVFIGGSSSFDVVPKPYNKLYAIDRYCLAHSLTHRDIIYIGDDYGIGGNDEDVYQSDIFFICVDNYLHLRSHVERLLI